MLGRCDKLLSPLGRLAPNFQEVAETKMRDERLERRKWLERKKQKKLWRFLRETCINYWTPARYLTPTNFLFIIQFCLTSFLYCLSIIRKGGVLNLADLATAQATIPRPTRIFRMENLTTVIHLVRLWTVLLNGTITTTDCLTQSLIETFLEIHIAPIDNFAPIVSQYSGSLGTYQRSRRPLLSKKIT